MPYFGRHQLARPGRRATALAGVVALVAAGATGAAVLVGTSAAQAAGGTVSGVAFRDYAYNGANNSTVVQSVAQDVGIAGVTVTATDSGGTVRATATTAADGTYVLNVTNAATTAVRVKFTPPTGYVSAPHGTDSASSVQFVQLGATNVNAGFALPGDYAQTPPAILQVQQYGAIGGTQSQGIVNQGQRPSLTSSPYTTSGTQADTTAQTTVHSTMAQTGAIWGVAQVNSRYAFTAAAFRRHAFVGPGGLGAIYLTNLQSGSANASTFVTIPNAGTDPRTNPTQDNMTWSDWAHDNQGFAPVSKIGLGGLAIAPDNSALYVVNVNNKTLYRVPLTYNAAGVPAAGTPVPITMPAAPPGCTAAYTRPWGASIQNNALWVTETCVGPAASDLRGYVYKVNLATDTVGSAPAFLTTLSGYARGLTYATANSATWNPWPATDDTYRTASSGQNATYPEPLLSDVTFDNNGDMSIGIKDRYADQYGYFLYGPNTTSTQTYESFAGGDQLRACGTEASGWTQESNGSCGSRTGYTNGTGSGANGVGNSQGPGGGEFYQDNYTNTHNQTMLGGLLQVPGYPNSVATAYDPGTQVRASGQRFQSNTNGQTTRFHTLQDTVNTNGPANLTGSFSKAGGMGDLTALVENAPIEIGNRLFIDADNDGVQDAGETAVSGATVHLYDNTGTLLETATTATDGTYYFSSAAGTSTGSARYGITALQPNQNYSVRVDKASDYAAGGPLDGYSATVATAGADRTVDSNGLNGPNGTVRAAVTTGDPGVVDHTIDFGFVKPVSVGDFVWRDTDRDGVQDAGEPGIPNVTVTVTKSDGTPALGSDGQPVQPVQTGSDGKYQFPPLQSGTAYTVTVTTPSGYIPTQSGQGTPATDSSTGSATSGVLAPGGSDNTLDFGFVKPRVSVGDRVFVDTNQNGIQDTGDTSIGQVEVTIVGPDGNAVTDINGNPVGPATTSGSGLYSFTNLPVLPTGQHYTVKIDNSQPALAGAGYTPTQTGQGTPATDSSNGSAESGDLTADGQSDATLDFGFQGNVTVGDFVWEDLDGDGIQDAGEPGIQGVQVTLVGPNGNPVTDTNGNLVGPQTTDGTGSYRFTNLPPNAAGEHYTVTIGNNQAPLNGFVPTKPLQGGSRSVDSSTGSADARELVSGASDLRLDFGFVKPVAVGDFVWNDTDRNGIQDSGEPGIENVTLTISRADGQPVTDPSGNAVPTTDITGPNGEYSFENLAPGQYVVTVTAPSGYIPTLTGQGSTSTDSSTGSATSAVLASGTGDERLDFGFVVPSVSVGDFVWTDTDGDGVQDSGEPGINGVTVTLVGPNQQPVTDVYGNPVGAQTTAGNGAYQFVDLPALPAGQHYTAKVDNGQPALAGYVPTRTGQGTPATDSADGSAESGNLTTQGASDLTLDFGFVAPISVGNFVWNDIDRDGVQDNGEPGIEGVTVTISRTDGQPVTDPSGAAVTTTKTTGPNGGYSFDDLAPGQYTVTVTTPSGFIPTQSGQGTPATDSSTGSATTDQLNSGGSDQTLDFGFVVPAVTVGDFVWSDTDGDGLQDAGEPGISGVSVTLVGPTGQPVTDTFGNPVGAQTTDTDGKYEFTNLPALPAGQHYTVQLDGDQPALAGYVPTRPGVGNNRAIDSSTDSAESGDVTTQGASDLTLDFGFAKPVSVGDFVWEDTDRDGVQDGGEPGIEGVTVTISRTDGAPVTDVSGNPIPAGDLSQPTGPNGEYSFTGLAPGNYTVTVTTPAGYAPTQSGQGTPATDSSTGTATTGQLDSGGSNNTLDFGFVKPVGVGNFVWLDLDRDGVQDAGEPGISGVTVTISRPDGQPVTDSRGNAVTGDDLTRTTDTNGRYSFDDLAPGVAYSVTVTPPTGYDPTQTGQGTPATDSSTGSATSGVLPSGGGDDTLDFGFVRPRVSVGDYVFVDTDRDGIQDADDTGIGNVQVTLVGPTGQAVTDITGNPVGPATTDGNGKYTFDNLPVLPAGDHYTVRISNSQQALAGAGYVPTQTGQGTPATDSSTGSAESTDLTADGDADTTLDFGFVGVVTVGDYVWYDRDGDGIQDIGEPGIAGVSVTLVGPDGDPVVDTDGNPVGPDTTDANGAYHFTNLPTLPAGDHYTVTIDNAQTALAGYSPTRANQGNDRGLDSSTGSAESGDLTSEGASDLSLDFGFVRRVSVGDFVWVDRNGNGVQDAGEPGIAGVTVTLTGPNGPVTDLDGDPVGPDTTDAAGKYSFGNLPALAAGQHYTVSIDNAQAALTGYVPTQTGKGTRAADSSTGSANSADLTTNGASDLTLDFGFVKPVTVGNYVWLDRNRNGVQDGNENGILGVVVTLSRADGRPVTDASGNPIPAADLTTTTDLNGAYSFEGLAPGQYVVTATTPSGYVPTRTGQGTQATDSSTGSATSTVLPSGGSDDTLDFGFVVPAVSVGDYVWIDRNGNGVQNTGEPGVAGVTVTIVGPNNAAVTDVYGNPVGSKQTNGDGKYTFTGLPALPAGQHYTVRIDNAQNALDGYVPTRAGQGADRRLDSSTGSASSTDLVTNGAADTTLDFGFVKPVSVGNFVWLDTDGNGVQNAGEPGVAGARLKITTPDGAAVRDVTGALVAPVTTGADGKYTFANLPPGAYVVTVVGVPAGYLPTRPNAGTDTTRDSSRGSATSAVLPSGSSDPTLDFGFVKPVSVGDYVWIDRNRDGVQDRGEPPVQGVELTLVAIGADGRPIPGPVTDARGRTVTPTRTDAAGRYSFDDLLPGRYRVIVTPPPGYGPTKAGVGQDRAVDSSTRAATSRVLAPGESDRTLDFGFVANSVAVGDYVWRDTNGNGRQDEAEAGIPGVVLVLVGPDGRPVTDVDGDRVRPTTTDRDGHYEFDDLPALPAGEHYTVRIDRAASGAALAGLEPTTPGVGSRTGDSSRGSADSSDLVRNGETDMTLDFGFVVGGTGVSPSDDDRNGGTGGTGDNGTDANSGDTADTGLQELGGTLLLGSLLAGAGALILLLGRRRRRQ